MEKGTLRVDANVSVRPAGSSELRTRCELKNMTSKIVDTTADAGQGRAAGARAAMCCAPRLAIVLFAKG